MIDLPEDDPNLFHLLLKSLYTSVVDPSEHTLADMLGLHGLAQKYGAEITIKTTGHAVETALHDSEYSTKDICDAARMLWNMSVSSQDPLRIRFLKFFLRNEGCLIQESFLDLLGTLPEFAKDWHRAILVSKQMIKDELAGVKDELANVKDKNAWFSKLAGWDSDSTEGAPRKRKRCRGHRKGSQAGSTTVAWAGQ